VTVRVIVAPFAAVSVVKVKLSPLLRLVREIVPAVGGAMRYVVSEPPVTIKAGVVPPSRGKAALGGEMTMGFRA
jgi:hypothetical protein